MIFPADTTPKFHVDIIGWRDTDQAINFVMDLNSWGPAASRGLIESAEKHGKRYANVKMFQTRNDVNRIRRLASRHFVMVESRPVS